MELLLIPLLLWLLGFIVFCLILRWMFGTDKLIYEARRQTKLLERIAEYLVAKSSQKKQTPPEQAAPEEPDQAKTPARPVYEINSPRG